MHYLFYLDTSENISGEEKMNGHQNSTREKADNKQNESEEENSVTQPGRDYENKQQTNLINGVDMNTEQELNEQAAMTAATVISDNSNKRTTSNESDTTSTRQLNVYPLFINSNLHIRNYSSTNG